MISPGTFMDAQPVPGHRSRSWPPATNHNGSVPRRDRGHRSLAAAQMRPQAVQRNRTPEIEHLMRIGWAAAPGATGCWTAASGGTL
ncbi:MAG: hypothetical protein U5K37_05265 [Natrialbaceae archaeon]|nr:hypothetical protein [Natrialbaceae archaeon]